MNRYTVSASVLVWAESKEKALDEAAGFAREASAGDVTVVVNEDDVELEEEGE